VVGSIDVVFEEVAAASSWMTEAAYISTMEEKYDMRKHLTCGQSKITKPAMLLLRLVVDVVVHRDLMSGGYFDCDSKVLMQNDSKGCRGFLFSFNW
jgi:hypothetical protein